ncbi:MAG: hypothetical protein ACRENG_13480, partial [bacterium]
IPSPELIVNLIRSRRKASRNCFFLKKKQRPADRGKQLLSRLVRLKTFRLHLGKTIFYIFITFNQASSQNDNMKNLAHGNVTQGPRKLEKNLKVLCPQLIDESNGKSFLQLGSFSSWGNFISSEAFFCDFAHLLGL